MILTAAFGANGDRLNIYDNQMCLNIEHDRHTITEQWVMTGCLYAASMQVSLNTIHTTAPEIHSQNK